MFVSCCMHDASLYYFAEAALILGGDVYICLRQPQNFLCEVPKQGSLTRLEMDN